MTGHRIFDGKESDYQRWLELHRDGYVLNVRRNPRSDYCVLHRATCFTISREGGVPGKFTQRHYIKVCAPEVAALDAYAKALPLVQGAATGPRSAPFSKRCRFCDP